jgi:predicted Zn-dependent protease
LRHQPRHRSRQINFVSESSEVKMGREATGHMGDTEPTTIRPSWPQRGRPEAGAVSERPDLEWHFRLLDSPVVNAFAIPGGYVHITRGILPP